MLLCLPAIIVTGCASDGLLTGLTDEPLPLEESHSPYPTAIQANELPGPTGIHPASSAKQNSSTPAPVNPTEPVSNQAQKTETQAAPGEGATGSKQTPTPTKSAEPAVASDPPHGAVGGGVQAAPMAPPSTTQSTSPPTQIVETSSVDPARAPQTTASSTTISAGSITLSGDERLAAIAQQRDVLIAMLQEDIQLRKVAATANPDKELARLEQQLRLLYAAANRREDATRSVESLDQAHREAYKHLMHGLATWINDPPSSRSPSQMAQVVHSLREASTDLAAICKLELRNAALCERVESFGWYTEFARNEFRPKQEVILYVEVDHFVAQEKGPHSFETELQGQYQIFDSRGQMIAERKLPLDREVCRNRRHDYFLAYPIYMPESIEPGKYRLELTVEDLRSDEHNHGRKFGEASIEFAVRS